MKRAVAFLIAFGMLVGCSRPCSASSTGEGFGDEWLTLMTARQAGTGGVAVEDPWRQGAFAEATTVVLTSGLRWLGLAAQGGTGSRVRLGADGFVFTPAGISGTRELPDGSYGGATGNVRVTSWGARLMSQWTIAQSPFWRLAALGRVSAMIVSLPDLQTAGAAIDGGMQAQRVLGAGSALTAWALVGPLGSGGGRMYVGRATAGGGWLNQLPAGLLGGPEGVGLGTEFEWLTEGLFNTGLGAVYWIGQPSLTGRTFFLRAGFRYETGSVQAVQPRAGLGVLWRTGNGYGIQFDYAVMSRGDLGVLHYGTLGLRFPGSSAR